MMEVVLGLGKGDLICVFMGRKGERPRIDCGGSSQGLNTSKTIN